MALCDMQYTLGLTLTNAAGHLSFDSFICLLVHLHAHLGSFDVADKELQLNGSLVVHDYFKTV